MTETTRFVSKGTAWLLLLLVAAIVVLGVWVASNRYQHEVTRSCMDSVVTPDPEAIDYDTQSLEFGVQIRKCMRS